MFSPTTKEAANLTKESATNDIRSSAKLAKREARDTTENVVESISGYAQEAGKKVRGFIDSASDEVTQATDKVTGEIRSNPIRSSVIALGVGFIIATLMRR